MRTTAAPFHPSWIVQHLRRIQDTGGFQEDDEVVVGVGEAEDLVPAVAVRCDRRPPPVDGGCTTIGALLIPSIPMIVRLASAAGPPSSSRHASSVCHAR
ncbi:hypothetical protein [Streptomyces sp. NPDC096193]|uniref:hypothetical protein n=1 Tax=Streptomyces sp. NPDC096193 TaxID=3155821 RepID=UPI003327B9DC